MHRSSKRNAISKRCRLCRRPYGKPSTQLHHLWACRVHEWHCLHQHPGGILLHLGSRAHRCPPVSQCSEPSQSSQASSQGEDKENYLYWFEWLARTWRWPEEEWSYQLVPLLTRQALEAYLAMDEDQAAVYSERKKALLEKFSISPETYRQRFRATMTPVGETPSKTYNRLRHLYRRWVRPELYTKGEIGEMVILEQFLRVLPYEVRIWVKEREPRTGLAAAKLAQQYRNVPNRVVISNQRKVTRGVLPVDGALENLAATFKTERGIKTPENRNSRVTIVNSQDTKQPCAQQEKQN
ncbi:zinc finger and SCAN domain-containing protein 32-like [Tachysurus fulvidraco]|uniref:zinc finger and SCAN domain-containing protein 32-like n=1 Tax=Tachysurus fulvidraco TaxID=1234273 RepID=UPI001FEE2BE1|nr:zinc finger and SCAN domain-containing protein 32-like [Tachysurus fulvidraco]